MDMLYFLIYLTAISFVVVLHAKTWIYFKIKNPDKTIMYGYLTGLIGVYFMLSLFPLNSSSRNKDYYKKLRNLTFILYALLLLFVMLGYLLSY